MKTNSTHYRHDHEVINLVGYDPDKNCLVGYDIEHTEHSTGRAKQRGIQNDLIAEVIEWGIPVHRQGYTFYVVKNRMLPGFLDESYKRKLSRLVVVMQGKKIITCYTRRDAMRYVKRKIKMML